MSIPIDIKKLNEYLIFRKNINMSTKYYDKKKEGTYYFRILQRDMKHYLNAYTKVDVIGETEKSYLIVLTQPIMEHKVGDRMFVNKKNVTIIRKVEETEMWSKLWYNLEK